MDIDQARDEIRQTTVENGGLYLDVDDDGDVKGTVWQYDPDCEDCGQPLHSTDQAWWMDGSVFVQVQCGCGTINAPREVTVRRGDLNVTALTATEFDAALEDLVARVQAPGGSARSIDDVEYVVARKSGWAIYVGDEGDTTGHVYDTRDEALAALQRRADSAVAQPVDEQAAQSPAVRHVSGYVRALGATIETSRGREDVQLDAALPAAIGQIVQVAVTGDRVTDVLGVTNAGWSRAAQARTDDASPAERLATAAAHFETAAAAVDAGADLDDRFLDDLRDTLWTAPGVPAALLRASAQRRGAESVLDTARAREREAIRAALSAGVTGYAIAQATGMTPTAIYKIRDGQL